MLKTVSTTVIADNSLPHPELSTIQECVGLTLVGASVGSRITVLNFGAKFVVLEADMDDDECYISERDRSVALGRCHPECGADWFDDLLIDCDSRRFVEAGVCTQEHADALAKEHDNHWKRKIEKNERHQLAQLKAKYPDAV